LILEAPAPIPCRSIPQAAHSLQTADSIQHEYRPRNQ
jgi:hypothetical protein